MSIDKRAAKQPRVLQAGRRIYITSAPKKYKVPYAELQRLGGTDSVDAIDALTLTIGYTFTFETPTQARTAFDAMLGDGALNADDLDDETIYEGGDLVKTARRLAREQ